MAEVTTTFFANAQAAETAIAQLEKKYDRLENAIRNVSKRSKEDDGSEKVAKWATRVASLAAGYIGISSAIGTATRAQEELNRKADEAAIKYDVLVRKVRVQAGLTELQGEQAKGRMQASALKAGVSFETAAGGAEEMISRGFDTSMVTGGGLDQILATIKATNSDPATIKQQVAAYAQLLSAAGLEKTSDNLEKVTVAVQRIFKGTPLQAADLQALAPKIQGVSGVMGYDEALAQFALMREKAGPDVAATALKIIYERLQTAGGEKSSMEALARMGIKPGDVDLVGEDSRTVLDRLATGLDKLKPEERATAMKDLFGQEAMSAATGLIRDRGKIDEFLKLEGDIQGFRDDVAIATTGKGAAAERGKMLEESQLASRDTQLEEAIRAATLINRQAGATEIAIMAHTAQARTRAAFGQDPMQAVASSFTSVEDLRAGWFASQGRTMTVDDLKLAMEALRTGEVPDVQMDEQTAVLREIRDLMANGGEAAPRDIPRRGGPEE